ncbi:TonB family protein [Tahibacter amnicola]|uniref:TonB family protein n=1 Tax=Tahibacter amnicola TaxID=2976241 RepID=A0ABY6BMK0_9GAMM|nr:TonB family protein [Tahibacter amnicola]UXI70280.1 TonB family protein [Tahibacter amnicola]
MTSLTGQMATRFADRPLIAATVWTIVAGESPARTLGLDRKQVLGPTRALARSDTAEGRMKIDQALEQARMAADSARKADASGPVRPVRKFLSGATTDGEYVDYLRDWEARIGRAHKAVQLDSGVRGSVTLTVAIRRDGSVERVDVVQPSGHPDVDASAIRIVHAAAPFQPLNGLSVDVLHITRTWQFLAPEGPRRP